MKVKTSSGGILSNICFDSISFTVYQIICSILKKKNLSRGH